MTDNVPFRYTTNRKNRIFQRYKKITVLSATQLFLAGKYRNLIVCTLR